MLNKEDYSYAIAWFMCHVPNLHMCGWGRGEPGATGWGDGGASLIVLFSSSSMFCRIKTSTKKSSQLPYIRTFYCLPEQRINQFLDAFALTPASERALTPSKEAAQSEINLLTIPFGV